MVLDVIYMLLVDFFMVVGDGCEDEKVFKWVNGLGEEGFVEEVVMVSLGIRNMEVIVIMI